MTLRVARIGTMTQPVLPVPGEVPAYGPFQAVLQQPGGIHAMTGVPPINITPERAGEGLGNGMAMNVTPTPQGMRPSMT